MKALRTQQAAREIRDRALSLNYDHCGIIPVDELAVYGQHLRARMEKFPADRGFLERFAGLATPRQQFPWARSIIVCAGFYGDYNLPAHLPGLIGRSFLADRRRQTDCRDYLNGRALEAYLEARGIRFAAHIDYGVIALRQAAQAAGLGLIRQNNFFYTEKGSWVWLEAWLIDQELEIRETNQLKPCPAKCDRCRAACPTSCLTEPYQMSPTHCAAYLSFGLGGDTNWTGQPLAASVGGWLFGCDACQEACPFNQGAWRGGLEFPGLAALADDLTPVKIVEADYGFLREKLSRKFWYVPPERARQFKLNALNVMNNSWREEYRPTLAKALADPEALVRKMASWVAARRDI